MDKFEWQKAVISDLGPPSPTTRLLLLVLGVFMAKDGGCYPSAKKIALASGLSVRSVYEHIKIAVEAGWLIKQKKTGYGKQWKRNSYQAKISYQKADGTARDSVPKHDGAEPLSDGTESPSTLVLHEAQPNKPVNKPKNRPKNNSPSKETGVPASAPKPRRKKHSPRSPTRSPLLTRCVSGLSKRISITSTSNSRQKYLLTTGSAKAS